MPALDWIVFKISQRCNLNCTYCYVYNLGDDSWKSRPPVVTDQVVSRLGQLIKDHSQEYGLQVFNIELHGGEPLLVGKRRFSNILESLQQATAHENFSLRFHLQTNGLLLDYDWLDIIKRFQIAFGISVDGPPSIGDRFRIYHNGRGSTEDLMQNIQRVRDHPAFDEYFGGVLAVLYDLDTCSPECLIDWYADNGFKSLDFLLPDGNYASPPKGIPSIDQYATFLTRAFEHWYSGAGERIGIRLFEYMIRGLFGESPILDSLGGDMSMLCTVESDGSIGESDVGRICPPLQTDMRNIFESTFSDHTDNSVVASSQKLCSTCEVCKYVSVCGGGYLPHRYDGVGFDNPSFYCEALKALSERISNRVSHDIRGFE